MSGYKISAVEIENVILDSGLVEECAVFALHSDKDNGNETEDGTIVALITPSVTAQEKYPHQDSQQQQKVIEELQLIMEDKFSHYKRPRKYFWEPKGIERNAMGKINKKKLAKQYSL